MNIQELFVPFGIFSIVVSGLVKLLLMQHQKHIDERFNELKRIRDAQDTKISEIETKVTRVEERQSVGVRHTDLMEINRQLAKVASDNENQTRLLSGLTNQLETIREYLLKGGRA